jgi:hypothetical protein
MALPLNKDGISTVAPASNTFLGKLTVKNRPDSQEQVSINVDQQQNGFAASLVMNRAQGTVRQEILFASLPSGISLSMERFIANETVTVNVLEQGFLRIVNEDFPEVPGNCNGYRILHTPDGKQRYDGGVSSDPNSDVIGKFDHPDWVNVDGRIGVVFTGSGKTVYHNRHYFQPWWAVADDLTLSRQDRPKRVRRGEQVGILTALIGPDVSPNKTAQLSLHTLSTRANAVALMGDGHLAVASFEQRPRKISLSLPAKKMKEIPIFEGTTQITKSRITYKRHLEAGQALLQKSLLALTTSDRLDVVASHGNLCLRNPGKDRTTAELPDGRVIKIQPGKSIWVDQATQK